jgi:hypothetical protein
MNKTLLAIASVCIVIAILSPIAVYGYFNDVIESYKGQIESYKVQLSSWPRKNEELKERIREYMKPCDPYLMEPYLTTTLGWYLHNSSDPFPESKNKLTVYGGVQNIGAETAYNCKLIVKFYKGNTSVQTSEINIGTIRYWRSHYINKDNINCNLADSVTRVEVERFWSNLP